MAITLVDSVDGVGTTGSIDTTGANFLVAVVCGGAVTGVSDSKGNTWTERMMVVGSFSSELSIWYADDATVGSGHTFTVAGTTASICAAAFAGVDTAADPFDQENGAAEANDPNTGSVTPSEDGALIIASAGGRFSDDPPSIDSGFTVLETVPLSAGVNFASCLAYLIQGSAAAVNPQWNTNALTTATIATFKAAAGGGDPVILRSRLALLGVGR